MVHYLEGISCVRVEASEDEVDSKVGDYHGQECEDIVPVQKTCILEYFQ